MLGVPLEMADEFTSWVRGVLEIGLMDPKVRMENRMKILGFFRAQLEFNAGIIRRANIAVTE